MIDTQKTPDDQGWCPLVELPCPQGVEVAETCALRTDHNFDPVTSYIDFAIMECARFHFSTPRTSFIKFWY